MPNLWGGSPVDRDEGGHSCVAQTISGGRPEGRRRGNSEVLGAGRWQRSQNRTRGAADGRQRR